MAHRKRRIILRAIVGLVLLLLALIVAMPLWLPWLLRPIAKSAGLSYADYERDGYSRFQLTQVSLPTKGGTFTAGKIEGLVPTAWLWNLMNHETNRVFLEIHSWQFDSQKKLASKPKRATSVYTNIVALQKTFGQLRRWLPHAFLTNGAVELNERVTISVPQAHWIHDELNAGLIAQQHAIDLRAKTAARFIQLIADTDAMNARSEISITNTGSIAKLSGVAFWLSNRVELNSEFGKSDSLPRIANLRSEHFSIPGDVLKLDQYRNLTGDLRAEWKNDAAQSSPNYQLDLTAVADPKSAELSPIDIVLHVSGNTNSARIETAKITLPWLNAELTEGTALQFSPPFLPEPTQLKVSADLSKQNRFEGFGTLNGTATVYPSTNRYPRVTFALGGNSISVSNIQTRSLEFAGELDWPIATIASSRITMTNGADANFVGRLNLASNVVEHGELKVAGAFGRELLPRGYSFESVSLQSQISGPFQSLDHSGDLALQQLRVPNGKPMELTARWFGTGAEVRNADLQLAASNAVLNLSASFAATAAGRELTVSNLSLHTSRQGDFALAQPFHAVFEKAGATNDVPSWRLNVEPMRWSGGDRTIELSGNVNWPERGNLQLSAHDLNSALLEDFLSLTNLEVSLRELAFNAAWTNGPIAFTTRLAASMKTAPGYEFSFAGNARGNERGLAIEQLSISSATQMICRAEGELPFVLRPSATNGIVQIREDGALHFQAFTETNSVLWQELASRLPLKLENPKVRVNVSGTWAQPQGEIVAGIQRLEIRGATPLPVVSNFNFGLKMNREMASANLNLRIQDQPVVASAEIPLGRGFWSGLLRERRVRELPDATGQLIISNARIAAFAEFVPDILAPQGDFNLDLKLDHGNRLYGRAEIYNAGTRPLASLGPVRSIDGQIFLSGRELTVSNLVAEIGGQRVSVKGRAQIPDSFQRARTLPDFQLHLFGTNVPLVREASALVRADLDLAITNSAPTNATITGLVRLHDSFFLSSLKDLVPGKVTSPKRRPPYFSVEAKPFALWRLGVQVEGDHFLKAQSPLFNGTVSANLRIEGTLQEPLALGEVRVNSGAVTFPFGSLDVQQGFVSLTSADPYHPKLFITAAAQRMGYDIKMEATGPADQPVLQFSSSPPLSSEQIVLMLTTGQTPQGMASASTRQRAQGLAMFVGKNLLSDLGIGGNGEGRLTIRSGEQVTDAGRPTYDVEYKLTDDWSIVGEYDRFSQYNLGLKWRVYTK